jgi:hypothetical protein
MAIANSYPMGTPKSGDLLLGTSVPRVGIDEKATTRNFGVEALATLVNRGYTEITKTLTNDEWIALPTTGIIVVPGVASKRIQVLSAYARFNYATPSFFFSSDLVLTSLAVSSNLTGEGIQARVPQNFEDIDGNEVAILGLEACAPLLGVPLYFGTLSTATNLGGGTVSITVRYTLI